MRIVSNPESESASASSWFCRRTRCWVARVPLRSARYVCSDTASREAVVCDTAGWSPSRELHSDSRAIFSAMGTVEGSTSNALRPRDVTVRRLGRQLDAPAPGPARDLRHLHGPTDEVGRLLWPHVDGGGEPHRAVDHHAHAHAEVRVVGGRLGMRVVETHHLAADALDPELGRLAAGGGPERGVGQRREVVRGEGHQATGVGWRSGSPAAGVDGVDELHRTDRVDGGRREGCAVLDGGRERLQLEVVARLAAETLLAGAERRRDLHPVAVLGAEGVEGGDLAVVARHLRVESQH